MEKLNKFNKKRNIIVIGVFLIIGLILVGISYAVYQKEDEVKFINAKVGNFETSSSDIELALTLDGEDITTPPSKGYYDVTVECDHADGAWNKDKWLAEIGNITSNRVKCNVSFESYKKSIQDVELGDYIRMTPTSTSYTPSGSDTGCLNDSNCTQNTLNPSELNLWRIIKKNADGTVEVVSEYVSGQEVLLYGQTGFLNIVGTLNEIASQYTNEKYVGRTRHMGYSNQIERCNGPLVYKNESICPADSGYKEDLDLVKSTLKSLIGKKPNEEATNYWVSTRSYYLYYDIWHWYPKSISVKGEEISATVGWIDPREGEGAMARNFSVRPILTLKSTIEIINGDGKSVDTAYQLN